MAYEIVVGRSESDRQRLGLRGSVLLGKHYVRMGEVESLSNLVYLDVNHSQVIFICGKRGSGKCTSADTLIPLADGRLLPIKELAECDEKIFGLNDQLKIVQLKKENFYKRTVTQLLKITFRTGKEISLTPEHPLLTISGWTPAKDLEKGDRLATPRVIPVEGKEILSDARIKLLAYLIAEGHCGNSVLGFTNFDQKIVEEFITNVPVAFEDSKVTELKVRGQFHITSNQKHKASSAMILMREIGLAGKNAGDKFIPECVFTSSKRQTAIFLNRLFSCDGTIYRKHGKTDYWQVSYASKSKVLITQVQHLLLRFGIISTFRLKQIKYKGKIFPNYELTVLDTNKFIEEINFFGDKAARTWKASEENSLKIKNPNIDTIPKTIWQAYKPKSWAHVGRVMNYAHPKAMRESARYSPSSQKLLQIAIADERQDIAQIAQADIFWDEIVSIEPQTGSFEVYDISVPEHHNFIANDIIVHNSYTLGAIVEGMANLPPDERKKLAMVVLDTMGIFWTMKYPNRKDTGILREWGLTGDGLDVVIFTPVGFYKQYKDSGIPTDYAFALLASELETTDWATAFEISLTEPVGVLIETVITALHERGGRFTIDDIITALKATNDPAAKAAMNRFENAKTWGLFSDEGTPLKDLIKPGQVAVLDVSCYAGGAGSWNVRALVIGIVAQKLFIERMHSRKDEEHEQLQRDVLYEQPEHREPEPLVWLFIDEAHEFLPREGKTASSEALITILREGRQPGISLVLATQQPGKIHTDVMTQSNIIISHRITAKLDTDALGTLTQSYMRGDLEKFLNELPRVKGAAIVLDDNNEKLFPIRVRPRQSWHGGSDPELLRDVK